MSFLTLLALTAGLGLVTAWRLLRHRRPSGAGRAGAASGDDQSVSAGGTPGYRAVEIRPCMEACGDAEKQRGRRYLLGNVPALPLPGCSNASCRCKFAKYRDRRADDDRRLGLGGMASIRINAGGDRRHTSMGRRESDTDQIEFG